MSSLVTTDVAVAVQKLASSHLCAIPTETVYGLAANAQDEVAIQRVFEAKGRPIDHPLIVHVPDLQTAQLWLAELPKWAIKLGEAFWPGPLTIVGKRTSLASDLITAKQDTVAVRIPDHPLVLRLLSQLQHQGINGIVAPSANRFGHVSPTTAEHVLDDLGEYLQGHDDTVLDGGASSVGIESTIVLVTAQVPIILRPGAITPADVERVTGLMPTLNQSLEIKVSGNLSSHYAPKADVKIIDPSSFHSFNENAGFIALESIGTPTGLTRLASPVSSQAYASELYAALRLGDDLGLTTIYLCPPPNDGIGTAIQDRIRRAAHNEGGGSA